MIVAIQLRFVTPAALMERRKEEAFTRALMADAKSRQIPFNLTYTAVVGGWCLYWLRVTGEAYDATGATVHLIGFALFSVALAFNALLFCGTMKLHRATRDAAKVSQQAAAITAAMRRSKGYL